MNNLRTFFQSKPIFAYLLPIFFVLHGFTENYDFIPIKDAVLLVVIYLGITFFLIHLSWLLFRNFDKANLLIFCVLTFHFFFGSIHDTLKKNAHGVFITKYVFILPVTFALFLLLVILLKKYKGPLLKPVSYLNTLLLLLVLIDTSWLLSKIILKKNQSFVSSAEFIKCDSCARPDIYFILADEYAGYHELENIFHYDNSAFERELTKRAFKVINNSRSNYNYTPHSVASTLNMNYLTNIKLRFDSRKDINKCLDLINENAVGRFFQNNGYDIINNSFFSFTHKPSMVSPVFIKTGISLITSQTFTSRLRKDILFNFISPSVIKRKEKNYLETTLSDNNLILKKLRNEINRVPVKPRLIYTHLFLPHYPYYFDENGRQNNLEMLKNEYNQIAYKNYLVYANKIYLQLIDSILKISPRPIIILLSDHGFRQFKNQTDKIFYFMNLNAVYLPDQNYTQFYDGMSNVNEFRIILNSQFHQKLPLLKDTSIFVQ